MHSNDRNDIFEHEPDVIECPDCGSTQIEPFDGVYYDDNVLLGFRYQCQECGTQFYWDGEY